jgi:RNA 2',3'-cyclic 3'-phosphodiesterase
VAAEEPPPERASREPTRRLFFALWPDGGMREAVAQATRKAARASGGRPVPADNLHVTLAFLGSVAEQRLPELAETARGAMAAVRSAAAGATPAADSIELAFDHLEYWRAAHLLVALAAEPPALLGALARKLQALLASRGFAPELKSSWSVGVNITRQFRPHVTLARKVYRPPRVMEIDPVTWSFADFVLVDSKTLPEGSVYTVLERFPLRH